MLVIRKGFAGLAFIDPSKKHSEPGQFISFSAEQLTGNVNALIAEYVSKGFEIRVYYKEIKTKEGISVPVRVIITYMPPGHVQSFHCHDVLHEVITVDQGEIIAVEDPDLQESNLHGIRLHGEILREGDMVVQSTGVRHTIANLTDLWARTTCVQVGIPSEKKFNAVDWKR